MVPEEQQFIRALGLRIILEGYNRLDVDAMYEMSTNGRTAWHKELGKVAASMEASHIAVIASENKPRKRLLSTGMRALLWFVASVILLNVILSFL